jgi:hypothetical protein
VVTSRTPLLSPLILGTREGFEEGGLARLVGGYESHPPFIPPHFGHEASQNKGGNGEGAWFV